MNSEDLKIVLVIKGSTDLGRFSSEILPKKFNVVETDNGVEGLALARKINPDLILCDVSTPLLSGLAICVALKSDKTTNHISVILFETEQSKLSQTAGLLAGADDYVIWPFNSEVLVLKIKNMISLREALRAQYIQQGLLSLSIDSLDHGFLDKLNQLVYENISDPDFGVHQMALQIGVSVSVLYRKLRLLSGITVNDFVKTIRMKRALQLLETGTFHVNEVATAVGYEDRKYFSREFRKAYGKTPSEIRRR